MLEYKLTEPQVHEKTTDAPPTLDLAKRQAFGAYYTPYSVATVLAKWAIRTPDDVVLEPCFGGCDFLEAVNERLLSLGSLSPVTNTYGCDIDDGAFHHLNSRLSDPVKFRNFIKKDYLDCTSSDFGDKNFDVIIGNPPYIKSNRLSASQRVSTLRIPEELRKVTGLRANLWSYFILHSLGMLKTGGRISMVLPANMLVSDYALRLQKELCRNFEKVVIVSVSERLFLDQGTEERTVILLCENFGGTAERGVQISYCSNIESLLSHIETLDNKQESLTPHRRFPQLTQSELDIFDRIANDTNAKDLGEISKINIGIVLGDKSFFIRKLSEWNKYGIKSKYLTPVVCRSKDLCGIQLDKAEVDSWKEKDKRSFLLNTRKINDLNVENYIAAHPVKDDGGNKTFLKRSVWHQPDDKRICDAFLSGLHDVGPKLVINTAKLQATNSLYRVEFLNEIDVVEQKRICVAMLSTFSQLSAELVGRPMGSGGLKIEPKDGLRIKIPTLQLNTEDVETTFSEINRLISAGKSDEAMSVVDGLYFKGIASLQEKNQLAKALIRIRLHRRREVEN